MKMKNNVALIQYEHTRTTKWLESSIKWSVDNCQVISLEQLKVYEFIVYSQPHLVKLETPPILYVLQCN